MIYGYARVSTTDQVLDLQTDALKAFGCEKIFQEKVSSVKERPILKQLLGELRKGDKLVVWKLDRLGRSLQDLITLVHEIQLKHAQFISLQDKLDTSSAQGRLMFNLFGSLAEFERDIIRERTKAGLEAARSRGRLGGRPDGLSGKALEKAHAAKVLYLTNDLSTAQIGETLGISRATVYRYLAQVGAIERGVPAQPTGLVKGPGKK